MTTEMLLLLEKVALGYVTTNEDSTVLIRGEEHPPGHPGWKATEAEISMLARFWGLAWVSRATPRGYYITHEGLAALRRHWPTWYGPDNLDVRE